MNQANTIEIARDSEKYVSTASLTGLRALALVSAFLFASPGPVGAHDIHGNLWNCENQRCCNDTDCRRAILPPSAASTLSVSDVLPLELLAPLDLRWTKVITKNGTKIFEQEFPVHKDKNGKPFSCVRPDPEEDLEVICLVEPE